MDKWLPIKFKTSLKVEAILIKVWKFVQYLHKKSCHQCLPDVYIIITTVEVSATSSKIEPVHDPGKLLSHIISRFERTMLDEVIITPLSIFMICKWRLKKVWFNNLTPKSDYSLQNYPWITHYPHKNTGNDCPVKKLLFVQQILLFSTLRDVRITLSRTCMQMLFSTHCLIEWKLDAWCIFGLWLCQASPQTAYMNLSHGWQISQPNHEPLLCILVNSNEISGWKIKRGEGNIWTQLPQNPWRLLKDNC